ncbi:MAG TPA: HDOD domain-containing protein [Solirubrobacteraceae bacterium]
MDPPNPPADAPTASQRVDAALVDLGPLPVMGGTVAELRALVADPESTLDQLVAVIDRDEAFAANLLRFANSAAAGRPLRVETSRKAVSMIGRAGIVRLAVEATTYRFLERVPGGAARGQMHVHALAVAAVAVACAEAAGVDDEPVHLAALLHDIGKIVLPLAFGEAALEALAGRERAGHRRAALERESLGIDHAAAGARLAERSGADAEVVEAIACHHGGADGRRVPSATAACVLIADAVVGLPSGIEPDIDLLSAALDRLGLPESGLDDLASQAIAPAGGAAPAAEPALADRVAELERLAHTDELTGLSNRRAFLAHVEADLAAGRGGALLLVDGDAFKQINDCHGHPAGDAVLAGIAHVLAPHGFAGRLGGDEFALWRTGDLADARSAGEAIVAEIARGVRLARVPDLRVTVSIGVAACRPGCGRAELLDAADQALYRAKATGKGRVSCAPPVTGRDELAPARRAA